jgi:hypothetical protein
MAVIQVMDISWNLVTILPEGMLSFILLTTLLISFSAYG